MKTSREPTTHKKINHRIITDDDTEQQTTKDEENSQEDTQDRNIDTDEIDPVYRMYDNLNLAMFADLFDWCSLVKQREDIEGRGDSSAKSGWN